MKSPTVLQGRQSSQDDEYDKKLIVVTGYLEMYAAISGRTMTPRLYEIFMSALEDLELRKIEKGLKTYLLEGKKFPWPADLREVIEEEV